MENVMKGIKKLQIYFGFASGIGGKEFLRKCIGYNMARNSTGKQIGTDARGNKYFYDPQAQFGRDRWVEVKNPMVYYQGRNFNSNNYPDSVDKTVGVEQKSAGDFATSIPPEWCHWLSRVDDGYPGDKVTRYANPFYKKNHVMNMTGSNDAYLPPGHWKTGGDVEWRSLQAWTPKVSERKKLTDGK